MKFVTRPLPEVWPTGSRVSAFDRRRGPFRSGWQATMELLERELRSLEALDPIVFEAGYSPYDIRLDGRPRANAKMTDPAVIVSFDSRVGPLRYGCDSFTEHLDNLRAIALTLEHLRAVDRYGVTRRGEQYQGWAAISERVESIAEAEATIRRLAGPTGATLSLRDAYRLAAKRYYPGNGGGSSAHWGELARAWDRVKAVVGG